jgi:hypothetical protein
VFFFVNLQKKLILKPHITKISALQEETLFDFSVCTGNSDDKERRRILEAAADVVFGAARGRTASAARRAARPGRRDQRPLRPRHAGDHRDWAAAGGAVPLRDGGHRAARSARADLALRVLLRAHGAGRLRAHRRPLPPLRGRRHPRRQHAQRPPTPQRRTLRTASGRRGKFTTKYSNSEFF